METNLPNFLCIGAPKAGTTTLQDILIQHPDIFLPLEKELHYFDFPVNFLKGIDWYSSHFAQETPFIAKGEITPAYLYYKEIPQKIEEVLGQNIKFIVMLRNPADRAYSEYLHNHRRVLIPDLPFEEAIQLEFKRIESSVFEKRFFSFISRGFYSIYIARFLERFPLKNFKFVITETDLNNNIEKTVNEIFEFLEVPEKKINLKLKSNSANVPKSLFLNKIISSQNVILKNLIPSFKFRKKIRTLAGKLNSKDNVKPPKLDSDLRKKLIKEYYFEDIQKLERMISKDLSVWYKDIK